MYTKSLNLLTIKNLLSFLDYRELFPSVGLASSSVWRVCVRFWGIESRKHKVKFIQEVGWDVAPLLVRQALLCFVSSLGSPPLWFWHGLSPLAWVEAYNEALFAAQSLARMKNNNFSNSSQVPHKKTSPRITEWGKTGMERLQQILK